MKYFLFFLTIAGLSFGQSSVTSADRIGTSSAVITEGVCTLDCSRQITYTLNLSTNCTLALSQNARGNADWSIKLRVVHAGGFLTWPGNVRWNYGYMPQMSTNAAAVDIVLFNTVDGGTTWDGFIQGCDMRLSD